MPESGVAGPEPTGRDCGWRGDSTPHPHAYLTGPILSLCRQLGARRVLDLGCGNGALCRSLASAGLAVVGCDRDPGAVAVASAAVPQALFKVVSVYDDPARLGEAGFDLVVSTEVVEHLVAPRALPRFARAVLSPGGHLLLSTPYHGYLKNLLLALLGAWDSHHSPLWDGGHVKFWSRRTLTRLLEQEGFAVTRFLGVGRAPWLWKSMILVGRLGQRS
jgi:2-polyprenyl-3-methyl-5-hydroxy-6-metoxy-1,4-benzoquinol methylase